MMRLAVLSVCFLGTFAVEEINECRANRGICGWGNRCRDLNRTETGNFVCSCWKPYFEVSSVGKPAVCPYMCEENICGVGQRCRNRKTKSGIPFVLCICEADRKVRKRNAPAKGCVSTPACTPDICGPAQTCSEHLGVITCTCNESQAGYAYDGLTNGNLPPQETRVGAPADCWYDECGGSQEAGEKYCADPEWQKEQPETLVNWCVDDWPFHLTTDHCWCHNLEQNFSTFKQVGIPDCHTRSDFTSDGLPEYKQ